MNETNRHIGTRLRELRETRSLSQREVAQKCHAKQSFVSKTEQGEHALLFSEIFTYAPALGLKPDDLFDEICHWLSEYAKSKAKGACQHGLKNGDHV
jgi:transcriptional regulator with XRE-family HTH domain